MCEHVESVCWNVVTDFDFEIHAEDSSSSIFKKINCFKIAVKEAYNYSMNNNESANTVACQMTDSVILIQSKITIVTLFSKHRSNVCKH